MPIFLRYRTQEQTQFVKEVKHIIIVVLTWGSSHPLLLIFLMLQQRGQGFKVRIRRVGVVLGFVCYNSVALLRALTSLRYSVQTLLLISGGFGFVVAEFGQCERY